MTIPYTYLIGWSKENLFYYGRRTAKNCNPNELWKKYFTSSKYVKDLRVNLGEPDIIEVRKTFKNIYECENWEYKVLKRLDVPNKFNFLNQSYHIAKCTTSNTLGYGSFKDSLGNIKFVHLSDPCIKSGDYVGVTKGKTIFKHHITNETKFLDVNDPLVLNNTYVGINTKRKRTESAIKEHREKILGANNPRSFTINIYNNDNEIVYKITHNIKKAPKNYNLPKGLVFSYKNNSTYFGHKKKFHGWYSRRL